MPAVSHISRFERLFRLASGLDVDKSDLKRTNDFLNRKLFDLLLIGQATASANNRNFIYSWDIPVTKGLQESMSRYRELDENLELEPILENLADLPMLDLAYGVETEKRIPDILGALIVSLAAVFKVIDPNLKNPMTEHWDKAFKLFDILL